MDILILAIFVSLPAQSDHAQPRNHWFDAGLVSHALAQAADGVTTWHALQRPGVVEGNPLAVWWVQTPTRIVVHKAAATVTFTLLMRYVHRKLPKVATVLTWAGTAYIGRIAYHNRQQGRR